MGELVHGDGERVSSSIVHLHILEVSLPCLVIHRVSRYPVFIQPFVKMNIVFSYDTSQTTNRHDQTPSESDHFHFADQVASGLPVRWSRGVRGRFYR